MADNQRSLIRAVVPDDASAWLRMRVALWPCGRGGHEADISRFFAGDRHEPVQVLVATDADGAPIGFAELSIRNIVDGCETDRVGYLEGWYVDPAARRRGVGRALILAAEEWARAQGCVEFGSDTEIENVTSQAVHRALGFEETGRVVTFRKRL